jgi:hypothetical protein
LEMTSNLQCNFVHQDASPKTLPSLQQIISFEPDTKNHHYFFQLHL